MTIDTLRADHVGAYGASGVPTPNLDRLASAGVRFDAAISPTPLTLPSHATLMTGLDPPSHGVFHNVIYRLAPELPTLAERMSGAGYATAAFVGALVLDRRFGLDRGFEVYDDAMGDRRSAAVGFAERRAGAVVDAATQWLASAPDRFFLWVHFYDPHATYEPPAGFASAFGRRPYAGEIAYVDFQLGRLLETVENRWGAGGLLVVATSDHGESLGEHGERTHSYTLYDATQRIPLIFRGPGVPAGRVLTAPVRLADVAPTIQRLAGVRTTDPHDGEDLAPLWNGASTPPRAAYLETLATQLDFGWSPLVGLRTERWKLIRAPRPELYDLAADPGETRNRYRDEPEVVAGLERRLSARTANRRDPASAGALSAADREGLAALGYLVAGETVTGPALGQVGGPDPKDEIQLLEVLADVDRALLEGRTDEAFAQLEALGTRGPAVAALRAAAGLAVGKLDAAERDARAVLAAAPDRSDGWMVLARALEGQGDRDGAIAAYRRALALDPRLEGARNGLERLEGGGA